MKAAIVEKPGIIKVKEIPEPEYNEYQCLVEILACGICGGADRKILKNVFFDMWTQFPIPCTNYPGILGHESVGKVLKIGKKVKNFRVGDLVINPFAVYPGEKLGNYHSLFGGFAELGLVTDYRAEMEDTSKKETDYTLWHLVQQSIPNDLDPIDSAILIPFMEVLDWAQKFNINRRTRLVILGSGPAGMIFAAFSKLLGAYPVIMVGRRDERLKMAIEIGADFVINNTKDNTRDKVLKYTNGLGATHIIEAIGNYEIINDAVSYLGDNGKIGIYGTSYPRFNFNWQKAPPTWNLTQISQDIRDSRQQVIDIIKHGYINPKKFYTHVVSLENIEYGFKLLEEKKAFKVIVKIK